MSFYRLPDFHDTANLWRNAGSLALPQGNPDAIIACNLAHGVRTAFENDGSYVTYLLMPIATDVAGLKQCDPEAYGDIVEVPAYSQKIYRVRYVDNSGESFPNEHRVALIQQEAIWPRPIPTGAQVVPPVAGIITVWSGFTPYVVVGGFSSWLTPITVPTYGLLVVVSMMYQDTVGAMNLTCSLSLDGVHGPWVAIPRRVHEPAFVCGGVNASMAVFSTPVGAGDFAVRMEQAVANTKCAQAFVYLVQGIHDSTFTTNSSHGIGTLETIDALALPSSIPSVYLASFSIIAPATSPGWVAPFALGSAPINTTYLAFTVMGTNGVYTASGLSLPTGALGSITGTGWLGTMIGME